jgi:ABC-type transport system involved in cytochrome c biogenesis permease subunit
MKIIWRGLPWILVGMFILEMVVVLFVPRPEGEWHTREFGRLPVLLNGRIQPFDSVARNSLLQIRSTGEVPEEEVPSWMFWKHSKKLKATEWLLEVMLKPEKADTRPIFLIHHPDLLAELNLAGKGVEKSALRYYTFDQIRDVDRKIREEGQKVSEMKAEVRSPFQRQVLKLANAVVLYSRLKNSLRPEVSEDFAGELAAYQKAIGPGMVAARLSQQGKEHDADALNNLIGPLQHYELVSKMALPLIVPPAKPEASRDGWQNAGTSLMESARSGELHPAMVYFGRIATAYRQDKAADFNQAVAEYTTWLGPSFPKEVSKGRAEFYFNNVKPFLHAIIIYGIALLVALAGLVTSLLSPTASESLQRAALGLLIVAVIVHTFGLVFRMVLEGRPPVTNLYSSAIFIGWGAVILGVMLEFVYRVGIGNLEASIAGLITLFIAHNLAIGSSGGDTMEMMRAVLDTNFWLATHVVIVTLGYASTFVAGLLAVIYVVFGVITPLLSQVLGKRSAEGRGPPALPTAATRGTGSDGALTVGKALTKMVYGIVCFATLFSFVGTILGGIWADQSWGRFWGWDPKENGALLIVIWNAIILHARWGGLVRDRGLMNLAILGNIITAWSWFGTNMLGIGLHAYGFMDEAFMWLMLFFISQLLLIAVGALPLRWWCSFRKAPAAAAAA